MKGYLWLVVIGALVALTVILGVKSVRVAQTEVSGEEGGSIGGFSKPESVAVGPEGKYYVSNVGQPGRAGDGKIMALGKDGTLEDLALGLDDPKGFAIYGEALYVADIDKVWRVSLNGHKELFLRPEDFPRRPAFLNDVALAPSSDRLYISDTQLGVIFTVRTCICGGVTIFAQRARFPELQAPNGLALDGAGNLLVIDLSTGKLLEIEPNGSSAEVIGEGFGGGDGLAFDPAGNLYISDYAGGRIFKRSPEGTSEIFAEGLESPADIAVDPERNLLLVPEFNADRLRLISLSPGG
ncbi:MAG: hypothetical protein NUW06_00440 [Candidatus Acetothermia bacterium]|jgi:sugar lactone lactonase YvrE|nr:hypothetical protein [Candidatus Acetothermia bacterium]MDH7504982.1 hypothetical protein [Candidatus Acetothermia bacterium]